MSLICPINTNPKQETYFILREDVDIVAPTSWLPPAAPT